MGAECLQRLVLLAEHELRRRVALHRDGLRGAARDQPRDRAQQALESRATALGRTFHGPGERTPRLVVIDLAETTFMDCCGMSALLRGAHLAAGQGRRLRAVNPIGIPLTVLQLTGVLGILAD